jgi:putative effector of murein hydrolase
MPTSYFGGYLALVGLSEMLLFVYLLLFYCCQRTDARHLRSLRLVASVIVTTISVAVLAMVSVKTDEYIAKGHSEEGNFSKK